MMCARFLKHDPDDTTGFTSHFESAFNTFFTSTIVASGWVLRRQLLILGIDLPHRVHLRLPVFSRQFRLFPQQDTGRISGIIQGDQDLSFAAMSQKMRDFHRYRFERSRR